MWSEDVSCLDHSLPDAGPEADYVQAVLLEAISAALDAQPANERDVFIAHELEGRSFKEMAARSGANVNPLLGRKRRDVAASAKPPATALRRTYLMKETRQ